MPMAFWDIDETSGKCAICTQNADIPTKKLVRLLSAQLLQALKLTHLWSAGGGKKQNKSQKNFLPDMMPLEKARWNAGYFDVKKVVLNVSGIF